MRNILLFILPLLFAFSGYAQETIIEFEVKSQKELNKVSKIVSIDHGVTGNTIRAYANPQELEMMKKLGYTYKVLPHPSVGKSLTMANTLAEMANWDRYPTHQVYQEMMHKFATDHPDICRIDTLGTSVQGRAVLVLKISDNPDANENEPEFYYTGQMHGDELVGSIMLLRLIDHLLNNYGSIPRVTNLVNNYEIWINPLSNPDGAYRGGDNTVSNATRSNANNVDLNRNFPSPTNPTPSDQDEPEVQMQIAFADAHHFVLSSNLHNGVEVVNYPWDSWLSSENKHADHNWWKHVSRNYADTVHNYSPSSYMDARDNGITHGGDWYIITGSRQDNMGYFKHCREFTLELSNTKMLDSEDLPAHWNYNRSALMGYIEECLYGFNGTVSNTSGDPLDAKIEIIGHDKDNSEVYTDPENGDYYRPIEPGTYNVRYSSFGYISQEHEITVSDWETTVIKNVVLTQAASTDISGTVTEEGSGNPLQGVKIEILNTPVSPVYTDANGAYSFTGIMEDVYDIKASLSGYTAVTQTVDISTVTDIDFTLAISTAISFESTVPPIFSFGGNADWFRESGNAYDEDYAMRSGNISNNQTSVMQAELNILSAGDISFYRKVSSEGNYDFLRFYIDGTQMEEWSGDLSWDKETYPVSAGIHTFKWEYAKDVSTSSGSDCAWIDFIEFPEYEEPQTYTVTFNVSDGTNPIEGANVNFNAQSINTNAAGQAVFSAVSPQNNMAWSVSKAGYITENGTLNVVDMDITQNVNLSETATYSVSFTVVDANSAPIEDANISFNAQTISTNASGQAVFNNVTPGNNLPYTITKSGYSDYNGTLDLIDADIQENVSMSGITYTVTFAIQDNNGSLEGANVNFNSEDIITNPEGKAVFNNVPAGTDLPYTVSKTGYNTQDGILNVNSNAYQTVNMSTLSLDVILSLSGVKVYPNPFDSYTNIDFYAEEPGDVVINIYSFEGKKINMLKLNNLKAGNQSIRWNASDANGKRLKSGIYFINIHTGNKIKTAKLMLLN